MSTYFHGWRRKAGCVTLVVALVLSGMWVGSRQTSDTFVIENDEGERHYLTWSPDGLTWGRRWGSGQYVQPPQFMNVGWESTSIENSQFLNDWSGLHVDGNWQCCGFRFARFLSVDEPEVGEQFSRETLTLHLVLGGAEMWTVPYWSIVFPLIIFSAYLIFSKPRKTAFGCSPEIDTR
jgi:hypothetical protein